MKTKALIISLIQQDLQHTQFLAGLDNLGLEASDKHHLQLLEIIANIMHIPEGDLHDTWGQLYYQLLQDATHFQITHTQDFLREYATLCYRQLKLCIEIESLKKKQKEMRPMFP